ncbi:nucleolar pre-ribosomal-associated protein 1 [Entophlyctis luteolus]|nr:nucleolar pre-ribosomal-associated protein 1 [Entophlyctis luteolus]
MDSQSENDNQTSTADAEEFLSEYDDDSLSDFDDNDGDETTLLDFKSLSKSDASEKQDSQSTNNIDEGSEEQKTDSSKKDKEYGQPFSLAELQTCLSSENVELNYTGLAKLNWRLRRIENRVVDHDVSNESEFVKSYFKSSPEVTELLRLWQHQQMHDQHRTEIVIVDVIANVLVVSKLVGMKSVGTNLAKSIIRGHMKPIYKYLSSKKNSCIQVAAKLLSALSSRSPGCTKELYETFNFTLKALPSLFRIRKSLNGDEGRMEDVRGYYIRFLLGFLVLGDLQVKKGLLEMKDAISGIFKGAWEDHYSVLEHVFTVLKTTVIDDISISRNAKMAFFSSYVLESITKLCSRNDKTNPINICELNSEKSVADLALDFLTYLCTRPGFGICLQDHGWLRVRKIYGSAEDTQAQAKHSRVRNGHLLKWALFLKPTENRIELEALLELLGNCPELVQPYWSQTTLSFEPRLSKKWMSNMALAANIIGLPIPSIGSQLGPGRTKHFALEPDTILAPPSVRTLVENILPSALTKVAMSRALQHSSRTVRHITAFVLGRALEKMGRISAEIRVVCQQLKISSIVGENNRQSDHSLVEWEDLNDEVVVEIKKRIPEIQIILGMYMKVSDVNGEAVKISQSEIPEKAATSLPDAGDTQEDPSVSPIVLQCTVLKLIKEYQTHFPDQIFESKFDFGKLVPVDLDSCAIELQLSVVQFLLEVPNFKWWMNPAGAQHSHLYTLVRMYCFSSDSKVCDVSKAAINGFLLASVFASNKNEIRIWLEAISVFTKITPKNSEKGLPSIISWFDAACCSAVKANHKFAERTKDILAKVAVSTSVTNLQTHINQNTALSDNERSDFYAGENLTSRPFSPVFISAIDGLRALLKSWISKDSSDLDRGSAILQLSQCFCVIAFDIVTLTQATPEFVLFLVEETLSALNSTQQSSDCGEFSFQPTSALSYLKLVSATLRTRRTIVERFDDSINMDDVDLSKAVSVLLGLTPKSFTGAMTSMLAAAQKNASYRTIISVTARIASAIEFPAISLETKQLIAVLSPNCVFPTFVTNVMDSNGKPDSALKLAFFTKLTDGSVPPMIVAQSILFWIFQNSSVALQSSVQIMFELLEKVAEIAFNSEPNEWPALRHLIFQHPMILLFFQDPDNEYHSNSLHLIAKFADIDRSEPSNQIYGVYFQQVFDKVIMELSPTANFCLSTKTINCFKRIGRHLDEASINCVLESILAIPVASDSFQISLQNQLLSCILTTCRIGKTEVPTELSNAAFRRLIKLLREFPSDELDEIFESVILASISSGTRKELVGRPLFQVITQSNATVLKPNNPKLMEHVTGLLESETLQLILREPTKPRLRVLKALITSNSIFRERVLREVVNGIVAETVFSACLRALIEVDSQTDTYTWGPNTTAFEISKLKKMKSVADSLLDGVIVNIMEMKPPDSSNNADTSFAVSCCLRLNLCSDNALNRLAEMMTKFLTSNLDNVDNSLFWINLHYAALFFGDISSKWSGYRAVALGLRTLTHFYQLRKRVDPAISQEGKFCLFENSASELIDKVFCRLSAALENEEFVMEATPIVNEFWRVSLKYRLNHPKVVLMLSEMCDVLYSDKARRPFDVDQLISMISGHSMFLAIIRPITKTTGSGVSVSFHACKANLVRFVRHLIKFCENDSLSDVRTNLLLPISSSYMGTQQESDREILKLWNSWEVHISSAAGLAIHWGQSNMEISSTQKLLVGGSGLISSQAAAESLSPIDPILMTQTIQGYPVYQRLFETDSSQMSLSCGLYDPSFFLPLIASVIKCSDDSLDLKKLVETNAMGLVVMSLASCDEGIRRAAFHICDRVWAILDRSSLKEKPQLKLLFSSLKNGILNRNDGVIPQDYRIYKRRHVFDLVMSFFHFPLADLQIRKLTFEMLYRATSIPEVLLDLVSERGVLTFMTTVGSSMNVYPQNELISGFIRLFTCIVQRWFAAITSAEVPIEPKPKRNINETANMFLISALAVLKAIQEGFREQKRLFDSYVAAHNPMLDSTDLANSWWISTAFESFGLVSSILVGLKEINVGAYVNFGDYMAAINFVSELKAVSAFDSQTSLEETVESGHATLNEASESLFEGSRMAKSRREMVLEMERCLFWMCTVGTRIGGAMDSPVKSPSQNLAGLYWVCEAYMKGVGLPECARNGYSEDDLITAWLDKNEHKATIMRIIFNEGASTKEGQTLGKVLQVLLSAVASSNWPAKENAISSLMVFSTSFMSNVNRNIGTKKHKSGAGVLKIVLVSFAHSISPINLDFGSKQRILVLDTLGQIMTAIWSQTGRSDDEAVLKDALIRRLIYLSEVIDDGVWKVKFNELKEELVDEYDGMDKRKRQRV